MTMQDEAISAPRCPSCDGPMVLRTNRREGSSFWGCRKFPACRGTLDVAAESSDSNVGDTQTLPPRIRVLWNDATMDRAGWQCRYTTAGGRLRSSPSLISVSSEFRQCWIARTRGSFIAPETVRRVTGAIRKLIQRGSNPPIHPYAERAFLDLLGLSQFARPSALPGDISVRLEPDVFQNLLGGAPSLPAPEFQRDEAVRLDSDHERRLIDDWVPRELGPSAARWFVPQASLDALTATLREQTPTGRRVDFLVSAPFGTHFVVEIDGPQHQEATGPDNERDALLAEAGIPIVRIPTSEIDQGYGPNLERVTELWGSPTEVADERTVEAVMVPQSLHRLVIALVDAVEAGFLSGPTWTVEVEDNLEVSPTLLWPYMRLFWAMDSLWGPSVMPAEVLLKAKSGWTRFDIEGSELPEACEAPDAETQLIVRLQPFLTALDKLERSDGAIPEIVVRSACLPVVVGDDPFEPATRLDLEEVDVQEIELPLTEVLQAVFAKESFREGQLDSLLEILQGRDCAVLLPTGGGKSLIYQMAGICKPGRTIVIDPLIALLEDQQRGLLEHGIDNVVGISSFQVAQGRLEALLRQVAMGDALFVFVAPERFQQRQFRESIRSLAQATPINLVVIDEAHCVSEWGHQFRTSYLTLGKTLRDVCKDTYNASPPMLALTGTASRAVLRDVLTQLGISTDSESSVVRPTSFDRPELTLDTRLCQPEESPAILTGTLRGLPSKFGVPAVEFFSPMAERTYSGLIFCPHVNGDYGLMEVQKIVSRGVGSQPVIYSGGLPRGLGTSNREWEVKKRESAESFKNNTIPMMVSTNAFGMGIDKPNIRYVFHYELPGSIEAFYQEVGRAGRDGKPAQCLLIWSERDRARSDRLTVTDVGLEDVRDEVDDIRPADSDSITQQLYLLLQSFKGVDAELEEVERLVEEPSFRTNLGRRATIEMPKGRSDSEVQARERALYRLMLLGVVEDYLVDSIFVVNLANISPVGISEELSRFIGRTAPGSQRAAVNELAAQAGSIDVREAVTRGASELITFIYEVIVESRRRSLREMYVAARDAYPGKDELRERVLDYLTRGDVSPVLERLMESAEFKYADWEEELGRLQGLEDARELRGNSARLLASSPFHPGLLYARAFSEMIHPEGDLQDFSANLEASLASARDRYGISDNEMQEFASWLLYSVKSKSWDGLSVAVDLAKRLGLASGMVARIEKEALSVPEYDTGARIIALASVMTFVSRELESAIGSVNHGR